MKADELLKAGRLTEALAALQQQVRDDPADPKLRVFLFQLLAVLGQWDKALTQLNISADMDPANLLMAQICRDALAAEAFRAEVFAGRRLPLVFGEPPEWVGLLLQSNQIAETGGSSPDAARELRERAFEAAPTTSGTINGEPFEWIADADSRLGPMLEAVINGRYNWIPFMRLKKVVIEKPVDLRDLAWTGAQVTFANGGQTIALIPTRYPGSEAAPDARIIMARTTEWVDRDGDTHIGLGQRLLATDQGEFPLMDVREIELAGIEDEAAATA